MRRMVGYLKRYRDRLRSLLAECESISNSNLRAEVISELPGDIKHNLNANLPSLKAILNNLIRVCDSLPDGFTELFEAMESYESNPPALERARKEWKKMTLEMDVQNELLAYIKRSGLSFDKLRQLYGMNWPAGLNEEHEEVQSEEDIIKNLWEYKPRGRPILDFMGRVLKQTGDQSIQAEIEAWRKDAHLIAVLHLDKDTVAQLKQGLPPAAREALPTLIIVISPTKLDANRFDIAICISSENTSPELIENISDTPKKDLEGRITKSLDKITINELAGKRPEAIEFYLPRCLLTLEVDQWLLGTRPVLEYCPIVVATLSRQKARFYIKYPGLSKKLPGLKKQIQQDEYFRELIRHYTDWEKKWKQLKGADGKPLTDLVQSVDHKAIKDLNELRNRLFNADDLHCVGFEFNPSFVENRKLEDLLDPPLVSGMPVIFWSREYWETDQDSQKIKDSLQKYIYDQQQKSQVRNEQDIIQFFHRVRRSALSNTGDVRHLGRFLVFIMDNPEREIPNLIQNRGL